MARVYVATAMLWKKPVSMIGYVRDLPWWTGILAGTFGAFGPNLASMLSRLILGVSPPGDFKATLEEYPTVALFFLLFTASQAVVGRLFGGKLHLMRYVVTMGWTWLPGIGFSALVSGMSWMTSLFAVERFASVAQAAAIMFALAALVVGAWTVRLQYGAIRDTMQLSRARTLVVYLLTAIPGFLIYDAIV